jgi:hypothetical protein
MIILCGASRPWRLNCCQSFWFRLRRKSPLCRPCKAFYTFQFIYFHWFDTSICWCRWSRLSLFVLCRFCKSRLYLNLKRRTWNAVVFPHFVLQMSVSTFSPIRLYSNSHIFPQIFTFRCVTINLLQGFQTLLLKKALHLMNTENSWLQWQHYRYKLFHSIDFTCYRCVASYDQSSYGLRHQLEYVFSLKLSQDG